MKILFTVENYYPKMSGVPVVTKYLAEGLKQCGHEIHIATCWEKGLQKEDIHNGITIHRFHIHYNYLKKGVGEIMNYRDFFLSSKFDAVICECTQCVTTDAILPVLDKFTGKRILHSHGFSGLQLNLFQIKSTFRSTVGNTVNFFIWKYYYKIWLKKYIIKFDLLLCLSEIDGSKQYLEKCSEKKVFILSNAAEDNFFIHFQDEGNLLEKYVDIQKKPYLLSVANYSEVKNQKGILKAFYEIPDNDLAMVFIGSNKNRYFEELKRLKNKLDKKKGAKTVCFLAGVERNDIPGIMKNAFLYIVGSRWEAFSISLIETMALGVPFISTCVGNAKLLPGGIVISSITDMPAALVHLLNDKNIYQNFSKKGWEYSRNNCRIEAAVRYLEQMLLKE